MVAVKDPVAHLQHLYAVGAIQRCDQSLGVRFGLGLNRDVAGRETLCHMDGGDFADERAFLRDNGGQSCELTGAMLAADPKHGVDAVGCHGAVTLPQLLPGFRPRLFGGMALTFAWATDASCVLR